MMSVVKGKRELSPPKRLIFTGSGDFIHIGKLFQTEFVERGLIAPDSVVLDVGCGIGRSAIPMTTYLGDGRYEGFDIMKPGVDWCRKNISEKYPNFNFKLVDLTNDLYKSTGGPAENFVFPYPDHAFDLVIVLSVFTHLIREEVERYMSEIGRVLKRGGSCYATFFILNETSVEAMQAGDHAFNFKYNKGEYSLLSKEVRSANVAFKESYLRENLFPGAGLKLIHAEYGSWSQGGGGNPIGFQDRVILQKPLDL